MLNLPNLSKNPDLLKKIAKKHYLQIRGTGGEYRDNTGRNVKWDVSNEKRIGASEVELINMLLKGTLKIIEEEEKRS